GLPLAELDGGLRLAGVQAGDRGAAGNQGGGDGEVNVADLGGDGEPDDVAVEDVGDEAEFDAELAEPDGDRGGDAAGADLGDGHRELAASQEAGELAVERHQVGLGEDLQQAVLPQGGERELEVGVLEDAEDGRVRAIRAQGRGPEELLVGNSLRIRRTSDAQVARLADRPLETGRPGDARADDGAGAGVDAEEVGADAPHGSSVELGDPDLEHDLLRAGHAEEVDDLGHGTAVAD